MKFIKPEFLTLKNHPEINEKWVQDRIADDPTIIGLGDLVLKDRERIQPKAGRLDLLLQHAETLRRYEVEIQLGATHEAHIIRTIEYWDIERKRYPQYDHCAVIVAEEITSRFLNVISLFNGFIPLVAIQMRALKIDDQIALIFTKVLDELVLGLDDDDGEEVVDRAYWENKGSKQAVKMADRLLGIVHQLDPGLELNYNKSYIGLVKNGRPNTFVRFKPRKSGLVFQFKLDRSEEIDQLIEVADLDMLDYLSRWRQYRIRLKGPDIDKHQDTITTLIRLAYEAKTGA